MFAATMVSTSQNHRPLVFHPPHRIYTRNGSISRRRKNGMGFHMKSISAMASVSSREQDGTSLAEYDLDLLHRMDATPPVNLDSSHCHKLHNFILTSGLQQDVSWGSKLIAMYASCGNVEDARQVFDKISHKPNAVLWTAMINGYARNALHHEALALYFEMKQHGIYPNGFTFSSVLKACAGLAAAEHGKAIHVDVIKCGFCSYVFVGSALLNMYAKCGRIEDACQVFDKMSRRDLVSWYIIIDGFSHNRQAKEAIECFRTMLDDGTKADPKILARILLVCVSLAALHWGKEIHAHIIKRNLEFNVLVGTALVAMYSQCKKVDTARGVFDRVSHKNLDLWNAMISAYSQHRYAKEALKLFSQMCQDSVRPSSVTISSVLSSCGHLTSLKQGKEIHSYVVKNRLESNAFVCTVLIEMYAKCGFIGIARQVFDRVSRKNMDLWNAMISAYSRHGYAKEALKIFSQMCQDSVSPSSVAISCVLSSCGHLTSLKQGKEIHSYVVKNRLESNAFVRSALIEMYAKCGFIGVARQVFDRKFKRDVISWTAMIGGYGINGFGKQAIKCFNEMQKAGFKPNSFTFVALLSACSHAGLVSEGCRYFESMTQNYHIKPRVEHYACMVDLLGRAGRLTEAYHFIQDMPVEPKSSMLEALLVSCRIHGNVELGENVARQLFEVAPENLRGYTLLTNIYAEAGRWDDLERVRKIMNDRSTQPQLECSLIEVGNKVHLYMVLIYLSLLQRKSIFVVISLMLLRSYLKLMAA